MRRTGKFYRKNEREVMEGLGLKPTANSGSGWIEKEDGESDTVLCQLKSTDKQQITVKRQDLRELEYHASVSHKKPVFALQFLDTDEVWLMVKSDDFDLKTFTWTDGCGEDAREPPADADFSPTNKRPVIESGAEERRRFYEKSLF